MPTQNVNLIDAALSRPNWLNTDGYVTLRNCDRLGWAWQWLRRDVSFRTMLRSTTCLTSMENGIVQLDSTLEQQAWGIMFRRIDGENEYILESKYLLMDPHSYSRSTREKRRYGRFVRPNSYEGHRDCSAAGW